MDTKLDKLEKKIDLWLPKLIAFEKRWLKSFFNLISSFVQYGIALWIYLWIYDAYGWERCLIALGVGVIVFGIRQNFKKA